MDPERFDSLSKTLSTTGTRRALVRLLAAVPVAGGLLALVDPEAMAGKNGKAGKGAHGGKGGKGHKGHKGHKGGTGGTGGTGPSRCTSDSCGTGCCDGTICQKGTTTAACGGNQTTCATCAPGETCRSNQICGPCSGI